MPNHSTDRTTARLAGTALLLASVLAIAGFTALGSVFAYPQILHEPTSDILALFQDHQTAVMAWFGVLIVGAALMAPAGVWTGRVAGGTLGRAIAAAGIAAAAVQVVGLQRWLTLVPAFSRDALDPGRRASAEQRFELWHTVLGTGVGETVFGRALAGGTAQVMGDPDQPHSYSYTPDVATALIALGTASTPATGQVWHLPVAPPRSTRQIVAAVYELAGDKPRIMAAGKTMLRAIGLVKPQMREFLHTLYQFSDPWVVDDAKFRAAFGDLATPLDTALETTLSWYADRAVVPAH